MEQQRSWLPKLLPGLGELGWLLMSLQQGHPGPKSEGTPGIWGSFPSPGLQFLGKGTSQAGLGGVRPSLPNLSILGTPCHILPRLRLNSAFFWLKWHRVASFLNLVFSSHGPPEPPTLVP